jgi:hypothetical protein
MGVLAAVAALATAAVASKRRTIVASESAALARLTTLNERFLPQLRYPAPLAYHWQDRVSSKAKFDRYDLHRFFLERLIMLEQEVSLALDIRRRDASIYGR